MLSGNVTDGSIAATAPETVTAALPTPIVSTVEPSLDFLIATLPNAPFCTFSLKTITKFVSTATSLAPSSGDRAVTVGFCVSMSNSSSGV